MELDHREDDAGHVRVDPAVPHLGVLQRVLVVALHEFLHVAVEVFDAQCGQVVGFRRDDDVVAGDDGRLGHHVEVRRTVDQDPVIFLERLVMQRGRQCATHAIERRIELLFDSADASGKPEIGIDKLQMRGDQTDLAAAVEQRRVDRSRLNYQVSQGDLRDAVVDGVEPALDGQPFAELQTPLVRLIEAERQAALWIEINQQHVLSAAGQFSAQVRGQRRLADPTLVVDHRNYLHPGNGRDAAGRSPPTVKTTFQRRETYDRSM